MLRAAILVVYTLLSGCSSDNVDRNNRAYVITHTVEPATPEPEN